MKNQHRFSNEENELKMMSKNHDKNKKKCE